MPEGQELLKMIDDSLKRLAAEVDSARQSAAVTEFLQTMAKFWKYSWHNAFLITLQKPHATRVAGYRTWQSMGRQVKSGEKSIRILAPSTFKRKKTIGEGEEVEEEIIRYFISVPVFDISQTEGAELPKPEWYVKGETHEKWIAVFDKVLHEFGWHIERLPLPPDEGNGYARADEKQIVVSTNIPPNAQVATSAHESGHVILHTMAQRKEFKLGRGDLELEAEAVSYVVCTYLGIETGPAHANYIAIWGGDSEKLKAHFTRIQGAASKLISALEAAAGAVVEAPPILTAPVFPPVLPTPTVVPPPEVTAPVARPPRGQAKLTFFGSDSGEYEDIKYDLE